jgi:hypothetical protein
MFADIIMYLHNPLHISYLAHTTELQHSNFTSSAHTLYLLFKVIRPDNPAHQLLLSLNTSGAHGGPRHGSVV